ncbi:MAG: HD domain-containing protein [Eggerthellaceae bacterium]|nr:HD domain-containing protein [Eggerthellaceae bacterium]
MAPNATKTPWRNHVPASKLHTAPAYPYLMLDPHIELAIKQNRKDGWVNPYRFDEAKVIRRLPNPHDEATLTRPAFIRDIEKILNVPAYNRYAGKTQVFSFVANDDICRRGLHVQLVSRIARTIGAALGLNVDLIEAIALGHDVGHTPFGHVGERYLNEQYHEHTGQYFNHNVHSVRVLDYLYSRNISLQTLDGVLCHNGEFAQQVLQLGTTDSFETLDSLVTACEQDFTTIKTLRPSTLEGCVVRVSDMIAYLGKDRNDALALGVLDTLDCFECSVIGLDNATIINNLTVDIINNSYGKDHICMSPDVFMDVKIAKQQNNELIYEREGMSGDSSELAHEMFVELYDCLLADVERHDEASPVFRHHVSNLTSNSRAFDVDAYLSQDPNRIVCDYIASMTDDYFMELYSYKFPTSDKRINIRDYCGRLTPLAAE